MPSPVDKEVPIEVIEAFKSGHDAAVRLIYRQFSGPIATVARSIVGNDQTLIDDTVQQTFTKAWKASSSFDSNRPFAPWLYTIARRTAVDLVRAERRPTRGDHEPEVDGSVDGASFEGTWEAYEVRLALQQLPEEEREVVWMSHCLGYSHPQIADYLGIPPGTVKSRSHRAYKRLARLLAHVPEQPARNDLEGR